MPYRVRLTPSRPSGTPARHHRRWRWGVVFFLLVWTILGVVFVPRMMDPAALGGTTPWIEVGAFVGWGLLLPLAGWAMVRERELAATRLAEQLAQANLQMLKMQLHPHFLFNTLNAISSLMHADADAADRMISRLSDLLRMALEKDDRPRARLKSELDFLRRYLDLEQIRFRDRLEVTIDVAPECASALVPRLILQPLVENAIRHGIAMRSAAGRLSIRAERRGDRMILDVADDGPGLPAGREPHLGVGLANTLARLEQLYGDDATLELVNAEEGGLIVHLELPFEEPGG